MPHSTMDRFAGHIMDMGLRYNGFFPFCQRFWHVLLTGMQQAHRLALCRRQVAQDYQAVALFLGYMHGNIRRGRHPTDYAKVGTILPVF